MSERATASDPTLHPIVELASTLLARTSPRPPHQLDDASAEQLRAELAKLEGQTELRDAVAGLIRLACHLDLEARSPDAAERLLRLLEAHAVEPLRALEAADGEAVVEGVAEAKRELDRFRGTREGPKAPKVGEDAPKGSVKLGSLDYPKRG
ncbi:hypothetical protein L6R52_32425 [Myxococcota bacterium]|nr:hypothetical protein [Myxococcota bacterium]